MNLCVKIKDGTSMIVQVSKVIATGDQEKILFAKWNKTTTIETTQQEELEDHHQILDLEDQVGQEDQVDQADQEKQESESTWDQLKLKKSEINIDFKT